MISVKVTARGKAVIKNNIKRIARNTRKGIKSGFKKAGPELLKHSKDSMRPPKNGRTYTVYWSTSGRRLKKGRRHRASKVGESPAILSGRLMRSMRIASSGNRLRFSAGTLYAPFLEEQTEIPQNSRSFLLRSIVAKERDTVKYLQSDIVKCVQNAR